MPAVALAALLAVQQGAPADASIVFIGVNVIPMEAEGVASDQTVVVRGDRIVMIGRDGQVPVPSDAMRIDGRGRYLVPGLTDAHVHLRDLPWAHSREGFGDAPLYLAYGVTTVINLGGDGRELNWRRRVADGEILGPTIYTSGAFVNEPRVATEQAMVQEIRAQVRDGYDLIKFHELENTTEGLSRSVYRTMIATARAEKVPLVGHLPINLGVDEWLQAGQAAARVGILSNIYFRPIRTFLPAVAISIGSALVLAVMAVVLRTRRAVLAALLAWLLVVGMGTVIPYGLLFDSGVMRTVVVALTVLFVVVVRRLRSTATLAAAALFAAALAGYWLPMVWRSSDGGIARFARRVREAGISVQSTLVVYELFGSASRAALVRDEAIEYLLPATRDSWRRISEAGDPFARVGDFNRRILAALHREGVPIIAGTDAMGIPLVPPGTSMHRELSLLVASGLTPYEALHAATLAPARFLGKAHEFGTITAGKRADLLLLERNPLDGVAALESPAGVMVRGRWLPRRELERMLAALRG